MTYFDLNIYSKITSRLDEIFSNVDKYAELYDIDREEADKEIVLYTKLKDKASLGDKTAREYLISQYSKFLIYTLKQSNIDIGDLINFDDIEQNEVKIIFEILVNVFDLGDIIKRYDIKIVFKEERLREIVAAEKEKLNEYYKNQLNRIKLLATILYSREYGQDCIDTIQHHNINEIGILDKNYIYIVKGDKIYLEFLSFADDSIILNIQKKTTQNSPSNYDHQSPTLVAAKDNSSRITVAGYSVTPDGAWYYNERIFNLSKISLEQMRDQFTTIDQTIYDVAALNQKGRGSHFITGSDMGVGKSTFLLAMLEKVPNEWGIGVLDTQNELQAKRKYPWKNVITLIETETMDIKRCFAIMLKMARDVLYVGEITQPREVGELINASLRLNSGVGATLHSISPYEIVTNLRNLMLRTDMYSSGDIAEADISRGLDLVFHLAKLPSGRIIVEYVVEVEYIDKDAYINEVNEGTIKERLSNFLKLGQMALSKYLYTKSYKYNTIVRFDRATERFIPLNLPSDQYFAKIRKYLSGEEIENFKKSFLEAKAQITDFKGFKNY